MIYLNDDGLALYLFDRSRLEDARNCPRLYYWRYGFMGIGIVRNKDIPPYWPFITGSYIHEGIELILTGVNGKDAANQTATNYMNEWKPKVSDPEIAPELAFRLQMELEQEVDLVKALVYGWYLVGYPRLLGGYTPVEGGIEQEEEIGWILVIDGKSVEVRLLTRTDLLAVNKASNGAILFNLKSVGDPSEKWRESFTRDMQTLTEAIAVEDRLGVKVDGVIIEGLVKGRTSEYPKGSGFYQSSSMLIYAWVKESEALIPGDNGGTEYATSWNYTCTGPHTFGNNQRCLGGKDHTLGKGFRKRPVRDCFPGGVCGWIDYLSRYDPATLESYFLQLPAITRDAFQVERWKRQVLHTEVERQDAAALVDASFTSRDKEGAYLLLDHHFPFFEGYQCLSCSYNNLCWEAGDPFDEGNWKPRVPNHLPEARELIKISNAKVPAPG
jgi:hypothetical protein